MSFSLWKRGWYSLAVTRNSFWIQETFPWCQGCQTSCTVAHFGFSKWEFFQLILVELYSAVLGSWNQPVGIIHRYESFLPGCWRTIDGHERRDSGQTTAEMHIFTCVNIFTCVTLCTFLHVYFSSDNSWMFFPSISHFPGAASTAGWNKHLLSFPRLSRHWPHRDSRVPVAAARPCLALLVTRGEPGSIPGLWCPPVSPSRNNSGEQNPLEICVEWSFGMREHQVPNWRLN